MAKELAVEGAGLFRRVEEDAVFSRTGGIEIVGDAADGNR
jgi:hypothetical protein